MAIFYVLPPRPVVGNQLSRLLQGVLPGLKLPGDACLELLQTVVEGTQREVYLIHREDLSDEVTASLCEGFGAEAGDQIVHISLGPIADQPRVRSWQVEEVDSPVRLSAFV